MGVVLKICIQDSTPSCANYWLFKAALFKTPFACVSFTSICLPSQLVYSAYYFLNFVKIFLSLFISFSLKECSQFLLKIMLPCLDSFASIMHRSYPAHSWKCFRWSDKDSSFAVFVSGSVWYSRTQKNHARLYTLFYKKPILMPSTESFLIFGHISVLKVS